MMRAQLNAEQLKMLQDGESVNVTVAYDYRNHILTISPPEENND